MSETVAHSGTEIGSTRVTWLACGVAILMLAGAPPVARATPRTRPARLMRPARILNDFETGLEGWQPGENTAGLAVVKTSVSARAALHRDFMLELDSLTVAGDAWRSVFRELRTALELGRTIPDRSGGVLRVNTHIPRVIRPVARYFPA